MSGFINNFKSLHINIKTRLFSDFNINIVFSGIGPFFTLFLAKNLTINLAALISFASIIISMLSSIVTGRLLDILSYKKVILLGQLITIFALMGIVIFSNDKYILCGVFFCIMSIGMGIIMPAIEGLVVESSNNGDRHFMYSLFYWANNIANSIGVLVGGIFFIKYSQFFLLIATIIFILNTIFTYTSFVDIQPQHNKDNYKVNYKSVFFNTIFISITVVSIILGSMELTLSNSVAVHLDQFFHYKFLGIVVDGAKMLGLLIFINTLLVLVFSNVINGFYIKTAKKIPILYISSFVYIVGYSVLQYSTNFFILIALIFIITLSEILIFPLLNTIISNSMTGSKGKYAAIQSLNSPISNSIAIGFLFISSYLKAQYLSLIMLFIGFCCLILIIGMTKTLKKLTG